MPKRFSGTRQELRVLLLEDNASDAAHTVGPPSYRIQYRETAEVVNERWTSGNVTISETKVQVCNRVVATIERDRYWYIVHPSPVPN